MAYSEHSPVHTNGIWSERRRFLGATNTKSVHAIRPQVQEVFQNLKAYVHLNI